MHNFSRKELNELNCPSQMVNEFQQTLKEHTENLFLYRINSFFEQYLDFPIMCRKRQLVNCIFLADCKNLPYPHRGGINCR